MTRVESSLLELTSDVFELRLPISVADGFVNVFLFVRDNEVDLIDCGMNDPSTLEAIDAAVRHLAGDQARIRRVLITHSHRDHYGGIGHLATRYKCDILVHRLELPVIADHYVDPGRAHGALVRHFLRNGMPQAQIERALDEGELVYATVDAIDSTIELDGAETLEFGERELELIWTPGHAPGHLCAFDRQDGLLFCGDLALPGFTPNVGLYPQSTPNPLDEFIESLRVVVALDPSMVYPSHGRPYTDLAGRADELIAHHDKRREEMVKRLSDGGKTAWEVADDMWSEEHRRRPYHSRLALQEALAHLQSLATAGRIAKVVGPTETLWLTVPTAVPAETFGG